MTYAWFDVMRNAGIAQIMHMSYCSKTYTWNDVILVKRSMIRVFLVMFLRAISVFPKFKASDFQGFDNFNFNL